MKVIRVKIDGTMNDLDVALKKKGILKLLEKCDKVFNKFDE